MHVTEQQPRTKVHIW